MAKAIMIMQRQSCRNRIEGEHHRHRLAGAMSVSSTSFRYQCLRARAARAARAIWSAVLPLVAAPGMLVATLVGVFIYPALFVLVDGIAHWRRAPVRAPVAAATPEGPAL